MILFHSNLEQNVSYWIGYCHIRSESYQNCITVHHVFKIPSQPANGIGLCNSREGCNGYPWDCALCAYKYYGIQGGTTIFPRYSLFHFSGGKCINSSRAVGGCTNSLRYQQLQWRPQLPVLLLMRLRQELLSQRVVLWDIRMSGKVYFWEVLLLQCSR
jgi:hypothetical protein